AEVAARLSCPISPLASRWGIEIAVTSIERGAERVAALCSGDELSSPRSLSCLLDCLALPRVVVMRSEERIMYVYFSLGAPLGADSCRGAASVGRTQAMGPRTIDLAAHVAYIGEMTALFLSYLQDKAGALKLLLLLGSKLTNEQC
ncbi:unnamed protein product, partial [Ectocarpus sp. 12 AP-2014]